MKFSPTALFSVIMLVASVGAVGIPTFNVNVANFPLDQQGNLRTSVMNANVTTTRNTTNGYEELTVLSGYGCQFYIQTEGYDRVSFLLYCESSEFTLNTDWCLSGDMTMPLESVGLVHPGYPGAWRTYEVNGFALRLRILNASPETITVLLYYFATA